MCFYYEITTEKKSGDNNNHLEMMSDDIFRSDNCGEEKGRNYKCNGECKIKENTQMYSFFLLH